MIPPLVGVFAISEAFLIIGSESILSQRGRELMIKSGWFDVDAQGLIYVIDRLQGFDILEFQG